MGREVELKFQADAKILQAVEKRYGGFSPIAMETAYFDTPDQTLRQRRWMLRRRMENGKAICTLKTPLPDGSRGEWETEETDILLAAHTLCKLGAPEELLSLSEAGLAEACAARLTRLAAEVKLPECTLEIALDQGVFLGGGREEPFCELEVELKSGSEEALRGFAASLAAEFGLKEEPKSKAQRAFALKLLPGEAVTSPQTGD